MGKFILGFIAGTVVAYAPAFVAVEKHAREFPDDPRAKEWNEAKRRMAVAGKSLASSVHSIPDAFRKGWANGETRIEFQKIIKQNGL